MATIKEAVQNATLFAVETLGPMRTVGLQLEEVESGNVGDEEAWLVTLSTLRPQESFSLVDPKRDYKVFTVLKKSGEVTSMKIRELAAM